MFYQASIINEILKCNDCQQKFGENAEPRLLPCGYSICGQCIIEIKKKNFKCKFCAKDHSISIDEFPLNQALAKMLLHQPEEVYRGPEMEKIKSNLLILEKELKQAEFNISNPEDKIFDNFKELKRQIQLKTEEIFEKINVMRETYFAALDGLEKKCKEEIKNKEAYNKTKFEEIKSLINGFNSENRKYLQQAKLDEEELAEKNNLASQLKIQLKNEINNSMEYIFGENRMGFKSSIKELNIQTFLGNFYQQKFIDRSLMKTHDLSKDLNDWNLENGFAGLLNNFLYYFVYTNLNNNLTVVLFDFEGKTTVKDSFGKCLKIWKVISLHDLIAIDFEDLNGSYFLVTINDKGKLNKKAINFSGYLVGKHSESKQLICCDKDTPLYFLDSDLNRFDFTKKFQIDDPEAPFFIPNIKEGKPIDIQIKNGKYFVCDNENMAIIDDANGLVLNKFPISSSYFEFDSNENIVFFCEDVLRYYDLNGNCLKKVMFSESEDTGVALNGKQKDLFVFYDWQNSLFYYN